MKELLQAALFLKNICDRFLNCDSAELRWHNHNAGESMSGQLEIRFNWHEEDIHFGMFITLLILEKGNPGILRQILERARLGYRKEGGIKDLWE